MAFGTRCKLEESDPLRRGPTATARARISRVTGGEAPVSLAPREGFCERYNSDLDFETSFTSAYRATHITAFSPHHLPGHGRPYSNATHVVIFDNMSRRLIFHFLYPLTLRRIFHYILPHSHNNTRPLRT